MFSKISNMFILFIDFHSMFKQLNTGCWKVTAKCRVKDHAHVFEVCCRAPQQMLSWPFNILQPLSEKSLIYIICSILHKSIDNISISKLIGSWCILCVPWRHFSFSVKKEFGTPQRSGSGWSPISGSSPTGKNQVRNLLLTSVDLRPLHGAALHCLKLLQGMLRCISLNLGNQIHIPTAWNISKERLDPTQPQRCHLSCSDVQRISMVSVYHDAGHESQKTTPSGRFNTPSGAKTSKETPMLRPLLA